MADITCIKNEDLISDNQDVVTDVIEGKALECLIAINNGIETEIEIAKKLKIPVFSTKLYLKKLFELKIIEIEKEIETNNRILKRYRLASQHVEILNKIKQTSNNQSVQFALAAQHFSTIVSEMIMNVASQSDSPHKIKAYFIKANDEVIREFINEINVIFEKYKSYEDLKSEKTYGLINVIAPFKNLDEGGDMDERKRKERQG